MTTFFTSDHHFGHANIIKYCDRPFEDVAEMDEAMIDRWNSTVGPGDEVWVLGDYAMKDRAQGLGYLSRMNGTKYLISGNHDLCSPVERDGHLNVRRYLDAGFDAVVSQAQTTLPEVTPGEGGLPVLLNHFPYAGDSHSEEDRHAQFRLRDLGQTLICGHVHDDWTVSRSPGGTLQVNVGVDMWDFQPISAEDLHRFIREQE